MDSLYLILVIGLTLYSIFSLISYSMRRSDNKNAFRELQQNNKPIRKLDSEELAALQPFLHDPGSPGKRQPLQGDGVYALSGEFIRHGLETTQGGSTVHDTLGGVDVMLPYDARDFLLAHNEAEVVVTAKHAIVVRLASGFDLPGARARSQAQQALQQQWQQGRSGELGNNRSEADDTTEPDTDPSPAVRILGQRDETPAEIAARNHPGFGLLASLCLYPGAILVLIGGHADSPLAWALPGAALLALGLWLVWRRRPLPTPQKVNRAQGPLSLVTVAGPVNSDTAQPQFFLGDKVPLTLPEHWRPHLDIPADGRVSLEMRVDDYSVVRFGRKLAIDAEEQRFPGIYPGRHLMLALCAAAILFTAWVTLDFPGADLAHARSLFATQRTSLQDAASLRAQLPEPGDMIHIGGQARCQLVFPSTEHPAAPDCTTLRLGGQAQQLPALSPPESLLALARGEQLQAADSPLANALLRMQGGYRNPYMQRATVQIITNLGALLESVDQTCAGNASRSCQELKRILGSELMFAAGRGNGWEAVMAHARSGGLKKEDEDSAMSRSDTTHSLRHHLRLLAVPQFQDFYAPALESAIAGQQDGILVKLQYSDAPGKSLIPGIQHTGLYPDSKGPLDWPTAWESYRSLVSDAGLQPFEASAMVTAVSTQEDGTPLLLLDASRRPDNALPALLRLLPLLIGALLLACHGTLWVRKLRQASQRQRQIADLYTGKLL